jgi:hypothetical protein
VFPWLVALPGKVMEFAGRVWNFLKDAAVNAWNRLVSWFTIAWDFYRALPGKVLGFAGKVWDFLKDAAVKAWGLLVSWFTTVWNFYKALPGKVLGFAGKIWTFLFDAAKTAWGNVTGFFTNTVPNFLKSLPAKFAAGLSGLWNALGNGLQAAWAAAKAWWNNNVASKKLTIGGFNVLGVQIPKIELGFPRLARGGVVPATNGGMMALIGEAGKAERVEPLDADGLSKRDKAMIDFMSGGARGGTTINVYPSAGMDERQLAELVSRKLAQTMRKGAA